MGHVTTYFDFSSPFAYLGCSQIGSLCERLDADLDWHPVLLGAIFKQIGTPMVPIMAMSAAKRRHAMLDLARYSQLWGVPFSWPTNFPMRTVTALRVVLAAQREGARNVADLILRIYRAYWAEGRDISDGAVIAGLVDEVGLDGGALVEATADPDIKKALFDSTSSSIEAGVFGVPTFVISDGDGDELIWGQDRLELVEARLAT